MQCKYNNLYSTVGGKPLQGCFTRAQYLMLGITDQVQFQLLFESRKGFGFPTSCRKTVQSTLTSDLSSSSKPAIGYSSIILPHPFFTLPHFSSPVLQASHIHHCPTSLA